MRFHPGKSTWYTTYMATLKKASLVVLALIFSAVLVALLFAQDLIHKTRTQMSKLSLAQCEEDYKAVSKENPNKMLFVSCGGFLD